LDRVAKSLEGLDVDLDKTPFSLGPWIEPDLISGDIRKVGGGDTAQLEQARKLARGAYRAPFGVPA